MDNNETLTISVSDWLGEAFTRTFTVRELAAMPAADYMAIRTVCKLLGAMYVRSEDENAG